LYRLRDDVEYTVESEMSQMTIQDGAETVRSASWIPQATNTHSENVILIVFPTATTVARTRLKVTTIVHCLPCFVYIKRCRY
jgi:hypothetical protein